MSVAGRKPFYDSVILVILKSLFVPQCHVTHSVGESKCRRMGVSIIVIATPTSK